MMLLYNILMITGVALGFPFLVLTLLASEKRRKTAFQRLGLVGLPQGVRKDGYRKSQNGPIWVHALSVGEVISAVSLVQKLRTHFKQENIVFSVSTKTGFEIANRLLRNETNGIFFFPYDLIFSVRRIVSRVGPSVVVLVESDIWPNFLTEMKRQEVPIALVNARLSNRSFQGYKCLSFFMRPLFLAFAKICTQTVDDAQRFEQLGVPSVRITHTGNLKFDQEYEPVVEADLEKLKRSMHIKPRQRILLAGSTHKGEEEIIVNAFLKMKGEFSDLALIIAPRNPGRAGSVCRICRDAGLSPCLLKEVDRVKADVRVDVVVIDVIGILRKLYALADIAFVGGSLVRSGGQNPLEPAAFAKPILFGPDMSDFSQISQMLLQSGGALSIHDEEALYRTAATLLEDPKQAENMGKNALNVFLANKGAADKTVGAIKSLAHCG